MRELTVVYKWDNGKEGTFVYPQFPEPLDVARTMVADIAVPGQTPEQAELMAAALLASPTFQSQYWGNFRQVLVTWRADAKRHRVGNKSTAPLSESETATIMSKVKLPVYKEPAEQVDIVTKIADTLTPAQIAELLAKLGVSEVKANQ